MYVWQPAQRGSDSWMAKRSRVVAAADGGGGVVLTSGGGGCSGWHRMFSRTKMPRCTGEVWSRCACAVRNAAWVRMPPRWAGSSVTCVARA